MTSKMLIDSSHPEETRVAVMKGNRVEEFDIESEDRKQLRGNIYLAKVTRVEPSLQAAFIEYGGNRHGFLAFSEIHPDYYQIPLADREALLREEAEEAAQEEKEDDARAARSNRPAPDVEPDGDENDGEEKPTPKRRRRSRRRSKAAETVEGEVDAVEEGDADAPDEDENDAPRTMAAENESESVSEPVAADAEERPKRRRSRRKVEPKASVDSEAATEEPVEKPKRRRATKKTSPEDDTSEEAAEQPKRRTRRKAQPAEVATEEGTDVQAGAGETADEKPAPKRRVRKKAEPKDDAPVAEVVATDVPVEDTPAEKPKRRTRRSKPKDDSEPVAEAAPEVAEASTDVTPAADAEEAKPRRARRSRSRKEPDPKPEAAPDTEAEGNDAEDAGATDALEEVPARRPAKRRHYKIQEVIKRRQIMLVQVVKEERGNKGAALTTYLSLAGRYSVLMPNTARGGGISRKITSAGDRKKLKEIASSLEVSPGMGVILRTAGAERTRSEITRDFEYLLRLWENVRTLTLKSTAPCLVYEEGSLIKRSIRDLFDRDTKEIWVAGREGYEEARSFMEMLEPEQVKTVRFYDERTPLFAKMGAEAQLDSMLQPQVTLKSGGYLVINQTEALVAIDVNSGKSTKQHSIEETAYQTNLEAADEVARQLRLRDLAGLIVIDFIDMDERRNNRNVEKRMKDALKNDRARIQVGRISHFGLMEMSRQRMRASVIESATETCPVCAGLGYVRSPSSVSIHVLRGIEEYLLRSAKNDVTVKTRLQTALHILNHKRSSLDDLEARFGVSITVEADETLGQSHYTIERGDAASARRAVETHVQVDSVQLEAAEVDAAEEDRTESSEVSSPAPEAAKSGEDTGKRRRRGRRGGRKPRDDGEAGDTGASSTPEEQRTGEDQTENAATDAAEIASEPSKPKRRRRKAAVKSDEPTSAQNEEASAPSVPVVETGDDVPEPPRPVRRPTSRPKRKTTTVEALAETAIPAPSDAIVEGEAGQVVDAPAASDGEPPRPKRRRTSRAGKGSDIEGDEAVPAEKQGWLKRTFFPDS